MTHALKTWPEYFKAVENGIKTFEIRKADRDFEVGDAIILQEYDIDAKVYTGKEWSGDITSVYHDVPGLKSGYVIFGVREKS